MAIAQTPPIDTIADGGVTLAFYLKLDVRVKNVSEAHRGVELQYSLDGPEGEFKVIKSWMDVLKFDQWSRQMVQIDNCSTPEVMSNNTIFRFILAKNEDVAQIHGMISGLLDNLSSCGRTSYWMGNW